jgi:hypothetical protein
VKRWLITVSRDEDLDRLREEVAAHGGAVDDTPPIPMDEDDQVLEAEGPDDLPQKLERHPAVRKVSPDSDIEFHRG